MAVGAWGRVALVAAGVVVLDQATKAIVRASIAPGDRVAVVPGVHLVHTQNSGVAFGALSGGGAAVTVIVGAALVALLGYFATHVRRPYFWLPTGMLIGGALGNVIDRVRAGEVTDFVQIPLSFPAFNVADMSITFGVLILLYLIERHDAGARRN
jgi:signal peptidase II